MCLIPTSYEVVWGRRIFLHVTIINNYFSFITRKKYTSFFNISRFYQSNYFVPCEGVNENINYNYNIDLKENTDQIIATCGSKLYARLNA